MFQEAQLQGCERPLCQRGSTRLGAAEPAETSGEEEWLPQRHGSSHPCPEKQPLKARCSGVHSTDPRMATGGAQPGQLLPDQSHPARGPGLCARHLVLSSIQILTLDAPADAPVL